MRILVVGAGAVGGYFGALLVQAGRDVTFLVRQGRREQLETNGLIVKGLKGKFAIRPQLVAAHELAVAYDLIFLTVKAYALESAIDDFSAAVGPNTLILPFLNGIHHIEVLIKRFGARAVLGGVCYVSTMLDGDGTIEQLADLQSLTYGELSGGLSERAKALDTTLQGCGFEATLSKHIVQDLWDKWIALASLGALTCLLRGSVGEIAAVEGGFEVARRILAECLSVANASGHVPSGDFLATTTARLTEVGSNLTSSMYRDVLASKAVEVEQILGDMVARARASSLHMPLVTAAAIQLTIYKLARDKANGKHVASENTLGLCLRSTVEEATPEEVVSALERPPTNSGRDHDRAGGERSTAV